MKIQLLTAIACVGGLFTPPSAETAVRPPFPYHFSFQAGEAFAFVGDQITSEGAYAAYVENFFLTRYPDRPVAFHNAGCANDTVADVLERLQADVVDRRIDYAFLLLGTWDGGLAAYSEALFTSFQAHYGELLDRLESANVHPILVSPPMFDQLAREQRFADESFRFRNRPVALNYNGIMGLYASWLRELAVRRGDRYIDIWGPLNACTSEERKINPSFSLIPDSIQPDAGGHAIIAASLIEALSLEREALGQVTLEYTGGDSPGWHLRSSERGSLSQLQGDSGNVSFVWKSRSLPWAFPDSAMIAVQMAKIQERFNREVFHVTGLQPGDYELFIDGAPVPGLVSHLDLAKGLALHLIPERPDQAQAQRLAESNERRYAEVIRPLRELWQELKRTRQGYARDDARSLRKVAELTPRMESLHQQARDRLQALYQQAQPAGRRYELRRVLTEAERKAQSTMNPQSPPPAED